MINIQNSFEIDTLRNYLNKSKELFLSGKLVGDWHSMRTRDNVIMVKISKEWSSCNEESQVHQIDVVFQNLESFRINLNRFDYYSAESLITKEASYVVEGFQNNIQKIIKQRQDDSRNILTI